MVVEVNMSHEKAESQLLELIRLQGAQHFTLTIVCNGGHWSVSTDCPDDLAGAALGNGESFAEAWFGQDPV